MMYIIKSCIRSTNNLSALKFSTIFRDVKYKLMHFIVELRRRYLKINYRQRTKHDYSR